MPNSKGWYSKEEVLETGLPYYIKRSKRWTHEPYSFAVLLSKSRCNEFGVPTLESGREAPVAFKYLANGGSGTGDNKHRFCPLYDRTSVFTSGEISMEKLFPGEIMGQETE
ncbi:hypothetical protein J6TS7_21070 [Paenibacillus dendritiformis]|uniref:hypothetical protein n=1 Tax=Paenibacillus TaxID=44249 RepID=UPI001B107AF9|nr:hypothetical protein [Paenibacillus dendritiformis]GIO78497.1 hypothetical protein J6TS7_21070 [Paenibacillus dendritiformis]